LTAPRGLSGRSFARLLANPDAQGKPAVLGLWGKCRAHKKPTPPNPLVHWTTSKDRSDVIQTELYDHQSDPQETVNVAADHADVVQRLERQLRKTVPMLRGPPSKTTYRK
jgi:hypothetical protein